MEQSNQDQILKEDQKDQIQSYENVVMPDKQIKYDCYLSPSTQNLRVTCKGKIIDSAPGQLLGIWDAYTGNCERVIPNIIGTIYCKTILVTRDDKEMLFVVSDRKCKLYDIEKNEVVSQYGCDCFFDDLLQHSTDPQNFIGLYNGVISSWRLSDGAKLTTLNTNYHGRSMIALESGRVLVRNNEGQIVCVEPDLLSFSEINSNGSIYSFCSLDNDEFAVGKNQQILIMNACLNSFRTVLKGYDEEYTCIAYLKDVKKIAAGSNKANIRIWELKGGRCIKSYGYFKQDLQYDYMASDKMNQFVLASNCKMRRIRVWKLLENQQLEIENTFEGDLNNIQRMIHLGKDHVALLCFAQYFEGFKIFLQEIRVYNLISYKCVAKKQIHRGLFIVEPRSMLNVLNDKLLYYSSSVSIQKNTLYIWDYQTDQEVTFDFTVEKAENALFYSFNRIAVPYCLSFRVGQDDPCQSAQTGMYVKGPSGISVYDFQVKQIWKIQFEYDFLSEAVEMIDKHTLLFINSKNQMEWWNTQQNQLVKRVECKPNIFKSFKCVSKMLFMQNSNKEIVIWDSESLGCMQKKKTDQILQKIQVFEDKAYLLFQNGILERFDFKKGVTVKSSLQFALKDYVLIYPEIVIAGETLMQVLQVESIF